MMEGENRRQDRPIEERWEDVGGNEGSHNMCHAQHLKAENLVTCFILESLPVSSIMSCIHNLDIYDYFNYILPSQKRIYTHPPKTLLLGAATGCDGPLCSSIFTGAAYVCISFYLLTSDAAVAIADLSNAPRAPRLIDPVLLV